MRLLTLIPFALMLAWPAAAYEKRIAENVHRDLVDAIIEWRAQAFLCGDRTEPLIGSFIASAKELANIISLIPEFSVNEPLGKSDIDVKRRLDYRCHDVLGKQKKVENVISTLEDYLKK